MSKAPFSNKEFIELYREAFDNKHNMIWVAEKLHVTYQVLYKRKRELQLLGVKFPTLYRKPKTKIYAITSSDVQDLNDLLGTE